MINTPYPEKTNTPYWRYRTTSGLRPYHFTYPERRLTMEEMLYKFIDEGKREHEEMRAFICDFQTTNEILFKERNNSLIELRFGVQEFVHTEEPQAANHDGPVESKEVLTNDQPQKTSEPVAQPSNKIQTPSIPFPQRLRKEKEEAQQRKFLENLKQLHINLPFIEAIAQMPKFAKFLKGFLTNKARLEEACMITMNERCSAVLLNKLPSKEKDQGLLKVINNTPTIGREVKEVTTRGGKTTTQDAQNNDTNIHTEEPHAINHDKPVESEEFLVNDQPQKTKAQELLANDEPDSFLSRGLEKSIDQSDLEGCEPVECNTDNDSNEPIWRIASINTPYSVVQDRGVHGPRTGLNCPETTRTENRKLGKCGTENRPSSVRFRDGSGSVQEIAEPIKVEREHLYSASANEIDEKKPELKDLTHHLEYAYLHGDKSFPIIISSELSNKEKISLLQVLEKRKGAIAWKMSDIKGISPSYCTHEILMER
ncbi:hypothetical protein Tco_1087404 [Tanacetum coccineum]